MKYDKWKTMKLKDFVEINPKVPLAKDTVAKKVAMENVKEFDRKIKGYEMTKFKSGSKFENNDTLMARITPCLENGKTAFVDILNEGEVGFGSTEFFVLRAIKGKGDPNFIYYLSISDLVRNTAINSMTGTSGRQRAQKDQLLDIELKVPPLKSQEKIGQALSKLDEKIDFNNQIIANLDELAQSLFKHWFIDFEFPNEEGDPYYSSGRKMVESEVGSIPEEWGVEKLKSIVDIKMGQSPKSDSYNINSQGLPLLNGASDFKNGSITPSKYTTDPKKTVSPGDLIFGVRATVGNVTHVNEEYAIGRGTGSARAKDSAYHEYIYYSLQKAIEHLENTSTGSVYVNISRSDLENFKIVLPPREIINEFHDKARNLIEDMLLKKEESKTLVQLRDTLLPKLLSGELDIHEESELETNAALQ